MIKRVFKTIFILTLCLGITLPANAGNVSVSDGSAFITKSEMSYQLNSLSNRMTQLENSLDSKIDKLVSSYLTRNGIWNGVEQKLREGGYIQKFDNKFELFNPPVTFSTKPLSGFTDNIYGLSEFFEASKSGLLCISVGTFGAYNSSSRTYSTDNRRFFGYCMSTDPDIANYDANVHGNIQAGAAAIIDWSGGSYLGWELMDGDNIKAAISIASARPLPYAHADWATRTTYTTGFMLCYDNFFTIIQCFVEKGKTYSQRLRFKYNMGGQGTDYFSFTGTASYGGTWRMRIDYANVY